MQFEVGDEVEYELAPDGCERRWRFGICDLGSSDKWEKGGVKGFGSGGELLVSGHSSWPMLWPMPGCEDYHEAQWQRPGYLRKVTQEPSGQGTATCTVKQMESPAAPRNGGCTCGAWATGSNSNLHSDWCDLVKK